MFKMKISIINKIRREEDGELKQTKENTSKLINRT